MPRQKKLAQAGRAGTKHSLPASPAVVLLHGRGCQGETLQQAGPSKRPGLGQQHSSCHPCFIQRELWAGLALGDGTWTWHRQLSELPCPVTVKQKYTPVRKIKETLIMGQLYGCSSIFNHKEGICSACRGGLWAQSAFPSFSLLSSQVSIQVGHLNTKVPALSFEAQDGWSGIRWSVGWNPS